MPIFVPEQGNVSIGQSQARDTETFVQQTPANFDRSQNAERLAGALNKFGASIGDAGSQWGAALQSKQDKDQREGAEFQAGLAMGGIKQDVASGAMNDVQLGVRPIESTTLGNKYVTAIMGERQGKQAVMNLLEEVNKNPEIYKNKEQLDAFLDAKYKEAAAGLANGDQFYGGKYLTALQHGVDTIRGAGVQERSKYYETLQKEDQITRFEEERAANKNGIQSPFLTSSPLAQKYKDIDTGQFTTPMKLAASFLGANEVEQNKTIAAFIKQGTGRNLDPAKVPWCAAWVDACIGAAGGKATGFLRAADFKTVGEAVTGEPKVGDIVVLKPSAAGTSGHVGFFAGYKDGKAQIMSGNHANSVSIDAFDKGEVAAVRRISNFEQEGTKLAKGGTVDDFMKSPVFRVESGNKTDAQNPNSSANGLGQFVDGTWLGMMKKYRGDLTTGKSDAQILGMKTNGDLSKEMTRRYAEENADTLTKAGIPINNANLYLAHFLGPEQAKALLKASDGTKVSEVVSDGSIDSNPSVLKGKTVSEVRQWAEQKMGMPVDAVMAQQNATRRLDSQLSRMGGLSGVARRDNILEHITKQALVHGDKSYLEGFPPEWVTPSIQLKLDETTKRADEIAASNARQKRADEAAERADTSRKLIESAMKDMQEGKKVDFGTHAMREDGTVDKAAWDFIHSNREANLNITTTESARNAAKIEADVQSSAVSGNWSKWGFTKEPTEAEFRSAIMGRADLHAKEKEALAANYEKTIRAAHVATSPDAKEVFTNHVNPQLDMLRQDMMNTQGNKLGEGFNYADAAHRFYEGEVRDATKAVVAREGRMPTYDEQRTIYRDAAKATKDQLNLLLDMNKENERRAKINDDGRLEGQKSMTEQKALNSGKAQVEPQFDQKTGKPFIFDDQVPPGAPTIMSGKVFKTLVNGEVVDIKPKPKEEKKAAEAQQEGKPTQVAGATPTPDTAPAAAPVAQPPAQPAAWNDRILPRPFDADPTKGYNLLNLGPDIMNAELIAGKTVGSFLGDAASGLGDILSGDPQKIIDQVKSGKHMAGPESDLGKAIIAHQEERLKKAKKK